MDLAGLFSLVASELHRPKSEIDPLMGRGRTVLRATVLLDQPFLNQLTLTRTPDALE